MGRVAVEQHAKRQVNIVRYADGSAKATITASGSREIVQTIHSNGCEIVNISRSAWERVGPAQVPAILEFEVSPDDYRIRYSLPAEKTQELQTDTQSNSCGVLMANPPSETVELEWNPWSVTLHCPTEFPNHDGSMGCVASEPHDTGAADGALHQTVVNTSDIASPRSWLYRSPMPIGRTDTSEGLPVHVKIIWALRTDQ